MKILYLYLAVLVAAFAFVLSDAESSQDEVRGFDSIGSIVPGKEREFDDDEDKFVDKRNFDSIGHSSFGGFKRNFDPIGHSSFGGFKRNFDRIGHSSFGGLKRSFDQIGHSSFGGFKRNFDQIGHSSSFGGLRKRRSAEPAAAAEHKMKKRSFDSIGHSSFGGFDKRNFDAIGHSSSFSNFKRNYADKLYNDALWNMMKRANVLDPIDSPSSWYSSYRPKLRKDWKERAPGAELTFGEE